MQIHLSLISDHHVSLLCPAPTATVLSTFFAFSEWPTCRRRPNCRHWRRLQQLTRQVVAGEALTHPHPLCRSAHNRHGRLTLSRSTTTTTTTTTITTNTTTTTDVVWCALLFDAFTYETFTPELVSRYSATDDLVQRVDVVDRIETMNETFAKVMAFLQNSGRLIRSRLSI